MSQQGKALSADYLFLSQDPRCGRRKPVPTNCLLIPTEESKGYLNI